MARRSDTKHGSEQRVKGAKKLEEKAAVRRIQSQYPARIKYKGKTTGQWYEWAGAGSIATVDDLDADEILSKVMNRQPCCNSANKPQPKFVEV
jgi:hypothetical protein